MGKLKPNSSKGKNPDAATTCAEFSVLQKLLTVRKPSEYRAISPLLNN